MGYESRIWYQEPACLKMTLEPGEAKVSYMDYDTFIIKKIGGEEMGAMASPLTPCPQGFGWVPVQVAEVSEGRVLVHFPVSNDGRAAWVIPEDEFKSILDQLRARFGIMTDSKTSRGALRCSYPTGKSGWAQTPAAYLGDRAESSAGQSSQRLLTADRSKNPEVQRSARGLQRPRRRIEILDVSD